MVAVFGQTVSPASASELLARLARRRSGSTQAAWADGHVVVYGGTANPAIAWDYTGQPYVGVALSNSRSTLTAWWVSTGRKVRAGA
jgi:prepilin-type processing-associated H-X9-DG protein